jgi:hypothetical protein
MVSVLNKLAGALSALGLGALAADLTGMADVPDNAGAQVVYVLAIVGGLLWRALPDQDDTPGPDVLQGKKLDSKTWFSNIWEALSARTTAAMLLCGLILLGCGGAMYASTRARACFPAYSDNCFSVDFVATESGAEVTVVEKPDSSISLEITAEAPGLTAAGSASVDPSVPLAMAEGCINVLFWERCAEASTEE